MLGKYDKGEYTKGEKVMKKRKLGMVFFKPNGRSAYMITKRLQVLDVPNDRVRSAWFAKTLNHVGYISQAHSDDPTWDTFGWRVEGDILEAIKND
jgi:hypothetical protein